ncbi:hypothetical protein [Actinocrispum sp. NPDC049592]|uniref:hypothetical protein n=1 Tax=Actinocrispum sp. NPDC049592 TaxID=3154835 RepID=UPI0034407981
MLPGAVRTAFWDGSGLELANFPAQIVMEVDDAVDAALAGLDNGEAVTIPSLPDEREWTDYDAARWLSRGRHPWQLPRTATRCDLNSNNPELSSVHG